MRRRDAMRYYCTYFDRNYLVRAMALHSSLLAHEKEPFTLFAVCLDEITRTMIEHLKLEGVVTVPLHAIEAHDEDLRAARANRTPTEYCWTLTPTVILRLLEWHPEVEAITYLDADLYFFSSPDPIFDEFRGHSVLIHEHRFHEEFKEAIVYGRFNVGLLCFRRDDEGMEVLRWWRDRCNEWCYCDLQDGKYGDQLYLDSWPERFRKVRVLEHIGAGVAPWNNMQYRYAQRGDGAVTVDGLPIIFYHFHALHLAHPRYVILSKLLAHKFPEPLIKLCYFPYIQSLHRAIERIWEILPEFDFGLHGEFMKEHAAIILEARSAQFHDKDGKSPDVRLSPLDERYSLLVTCQVVPGHV